MYPLLSTMDLQAKSYWLCLVPHSGDRGCSTCNIKSVTVKLEKVIQTHTCLKITRQQLKGQQSLLGKMLNSQVRQEKG